jgi:hypothetical protein
LHVFGVDDLLYQGARVRVEIFETGDVDLVDDEDGGFAAEERFDGVE